MLVIVRVNFRFFNVQRTTLMFYPTQSISFLFLFGTEKELFSISFGDRGSSVQKVQKQKRFFSQAAKHVKVLLSFGPS